VRDTGSVGSEPLVYIFLGFDSSGITFILYAESLMIGKPSNDKSLWEQENKHNFMANNFFKPKTEKMLRKQLWISLINQLIHKLKKKK
jgi:hypothetical protein